MLYASSKTNLEREAGATKVGKRGKCINTNTVINFFLLKVVELREAEQLDMEWLRGELAL
jgi:hypothetical protein